VGGPPGRIQGVALHVISLIIIGKREVEKGVNLILHFHVTRTKPNRRSGRSEVSLGISTYINTM
jgi:hypothetical protein